MLVCMRVSMLDFRMYMLVSMYVAFQKMCMLVCMQLGMLACIHVCTLDFRIYVRCNVGFWKALCRYVFWYICMLDFRKYVCWYVGILEWFVLVCMYVRMLEYRITVLRLIVSEQLLQCIVHVEDSVVAVVAFIYIRSRCFEFNVLYPSVFNIAYFSQSVSYVIGNISYIFFVISKGLIDFC